MTSQFSDMTSSPKIFNVALFLLSSLVTDPSFMSTSWLVLELWQLSFFIRDWPENPEIGKTPVWVLPNIWRLKQVRNTKFGTKVSNKMLLNAAKCQGYNFYCFWVIKGKPTGERGKIPPPQIRANNKWKKKVECNLECVYMRPEIKYNQKKKSFCHEKIPAHITFHCCRNEMWFHSGGGRGNGALKNINKTERDIETSMLEPTMQTFIEEVLG